MEEKPRAKTKRCNAPLALGISGDACKYSLAAQTRCRGFSDSVTRPLLRCAMMSVGAYHSAVALGAKKLKGGDAVRPERTNTNQLAPSWVPLQGQHKERLENSTGTVNWRRYFGMDLSVERCRLRELFLSG
jgi:hypothetical protein